MIDQVKHSADPANFRASTLSPSRPLNQGCWEAQFFGKYSNAYSELGNLDMYLKPTWLQVQV